MSRQIPGKGKGKGTAIAASKGKPATAAAAPAAARSYKSSAASYGNDLFTEESYDSESEEQEDDTNEQRSDIEEDDDEAVFFGPVRAPPSPAISPISYAAAASTVSKGKLVEAGQWLKVIEDAKGFHAVKETIEHAPFIAFRRQWAAHSDSTICIAIPSSAAGAVGSHVTKNSVSVFLFDLIRAKSDRGLYDLMHEYFKRLLTAASPAKVSFDFNVQYAMYAKLHDIVVNNVVNLLELEMAVYGKLRCAESKIAQAMVDELCGYDVNVAHELTRMQGSPSNDYWAQRPLTRKMIQFATQFPLRVMFTFLKMKETEKEKNASNSSAAKPLNSNSSPSVSGRNSSGSTSKSELLNGERPSAQSGESDPYPPFAAELPASLAANLRHGVLILRDESMINELRAFMNAGMIDRVAVKVFYHTDKSVDSFLLALPIDPAVVIYFDLAHFKSKRLPLFFQCIKFLSYILSDRKILKITLTASIRGHFCHLHDIQAKAFIQVDTLTTELFGSAGNEEYGKIHLRAKKRIGYDDGLKNKILSMRNETGPLQWISDNRLSDDFLRFYRQDILRTMANFEEVMAYAVNTKATLPLAVQKLIIPLPQYAAELPYVYMCDTPSSVRLAGFILQRAAAVAVHRSDMIDSESTSAIQMAAAFGGLKGKTALVFCFDFESAYDENDSGLWNAMDECVADVLSNSSIVKVVECMANVQKMLLAQPIYDLQSKTVSRALQKSVDEELENQHRNGAIHAGGTFNPEVLRDDAEHLRKLLLLYQRLENVKNDDEKNEQKQGQSDEKVAAVWQPAAREISTGKDVKVWKEASSAETQKASARNGAEKPTEEKKGAQSIQSSRSQTPISNNARLVQLAASSPTTFSAAGPVSASSDRRTASSAVVTASKGEVLPQPPPPYSAASTSEKTPQATSAASRQIQGEREGEVRTLNSASVQDSMAPAMSMSISAASIPTQPPFQSFASAAAVTAYPPHSALSHAAASSSTAVSSMNSGAAGPKPVSESIEELVHSPFVSSALSSSEGMMAFLKNSIEFSSYWTPLQTQAQQASFRRIMDTLSSRLLGQAIPMPNHNLTQALASTQPPPAMPQSPSPLNYQFVGMNVPSVAGSSMSQFHNPVQPFMHIPPAPAANILPASAAGFIGYKHNPFRGTP